MTNQQSSERQTTRLNRRALRQMSNKMSDSTPPRSHRKRGVLPSFGDIILPVVGVAAIGLLAVAGRQFFLNGIQSSPGIASTRAYADSPVLIAERERREKREKNRLHQTLQREIQIENQREKELETSQTTNKIPENLDFKNNNLAITVEPAKPAKTSEPPKSSKPVKTVVKSVPAPKPQPDKPAKIPDSKQWRVQIGAFGNKQIAQDTAKKINKAGHKTIVYSNPASKYVKVWVLAGATKQDAEKVTSSMKKMGFKGAYAVPPIK